ncbi:hypothetical protein M942_13100 [Enterobacter ludwigii]|nr:hypothetical protein M942_13100 [Enterobacter ludwigii]
MNCLEVIAIISIDTLAILVFLAGLVLFLWVFIELFHC